VTKPPPETVRDVLASFRLDGRTCLVTGAGRGLGRAMALGLAQAGGRLMLVDVNPEDLASVEAELQTAGSPAATAVVDVGDEGQVQACIAETLRRFGGLQVLVNNAGVTSRSPFEDLLLEDWERVLRVNLTGTYLCCKHAARPMIAQGGGSIINIASMSGLVGNRGGDNSHYCATKGGVIALTRSLAVEWARHGIRVNAVAPGYCVTPMTDRLKQRDPAFYQELIDRVPLGRFGTGQDLAGAVVYLASDAAVYVSGSVLVVDGGYTAW
jgi:NAD(P)-dependent dehydrogenase (short-subunit alcohol dehydrogenase family)